MDDEQLIYLDVHTLGLWERAPVLMQDEVVAGTTTLDLLDDTDEYASDHGWWYAHSLIDQDDDRDPFTLVELLVDDVVHTQRRTQVVDVRRSGYLQLGQH